MEKSWKFSRLFCQDQDSGSQDQDQDCCTLLFVLEAPRDQDFGLEDYITGSNNNKRQTQTERTKEKRYTNFTPCSRKKNNETVADFQSSFTGRFNEKFAIKFR